MIFYCILPWKSNPLLPSKIILSCVLWHVLIHYSHRGSLCHAFGNPIAVISTIGYFSKRVFSSCLKVLLGWIAFVKYAMQHSWAYSFSCEIALFWIHGFCSFLGSCGFHGYFLFHMRAWCAMQLRNTDRLFIQLSRYESTYKKCLREEWGKFTGYQLLSSFWLKVMRTDEDGNTTRWDRGTLPIRNLYPKWGMLRFGRMKKVTNWIWILWFIVSY